MEIRELLPKPNPNPSEFWVRLGGSADRVRLLVYSSSLVRVAEFELPGREGEGWCRGTTRLEGLANGTYFVCALAERGPTKSKRSAAVKVVLIK